jgi:hypothetical protein
VSNSANALTRARLILLAPIADSFSSRHARRGLQSTSSIDMKLHPSCLLSYRQPPVYTCAHGRDGPSLGPHADPSQASRRSWDMCVIRIASHEMIVMHTVCALPDSRGVTPAADSGKRTRYRNQPMGGIWQTCLCAQSPLKQAGRTQRKWETA